MVALPGIPRAQSLPVTRLLRDLVAVLLAVVVAVVPAWAGSTACARRGTVPGAPMACCLTPASDEPLEPLEPLAEAAAASCCGVRSQPSSSLLQAFERSGCNCRLDGGAPQRPAAPQEVESALERELRARFDACVTALAVAVPAPEAQRAHASSGRAPSMRAPPPGRARSARELLTRLCIARL
jgi:hypothetical protein